MTHLVGGFEWMHAAGGRGPLDMEDGDGTAAGPGGDDRRTQPQAGQGNDAATGPSEGAAGWTYGLTGSLWRHHCGQLATAIGPCPCETPEADE